MELVALATAALFLLGVNAFFVLAEFSIVKVRSTQVAELASKGDSRAGGLAGIHKSLDEYLSVCQVGITLASIALGMVGDMAATTIAGPGHHDTLRRAAAFGVSYILVSGAHIVLGELVPKSVAIRIAGRAALFCSRPLRASRALFYPALWLLNLLANGILRLIRMSPAGADEHHSEEELRIILDRSQEQGLMSFRRLLFLENVFDFGSLTARDAMRPRSSVTCLDARLPWQENLRVVKASRFTRYPLVMSDGARPAGLIHLKDVLVRTDPHSPDLASIVRPILSAASDTSLETLLGEMQRRRIHAALVDDDRGSWTGFVTLEDIVEELVGTIRDEFEEDELIRLADALHADHIFLGVEGDTPLSAVRAAMARVGDRNLPLPAAHMMGALEDRERLVGTYVGRGVSLPHARLAGLTKPFLMLLRSDAGLPVDGTDEKIHLLFVLLTPVGQPRVHQRLLALIAGLLQESDYVRERLLTATSPGEVLEVLRAGEQAALG